MKNHMTLKLKNEFGSGLYDGPKYSGIKEIQAWFVRGLKDGFRNRIVDFILVGHELEAYFNGMQSGIAERKRAEKLAAYKHLVAVKRIPMVKP